MARQDLLPGNRFRVYRETDTPDQFEFICEGVTVTFNRTAEFEDATVPDCDNPTATPVRRSVRKSRSWSLNFSGKASAKRFDKLEHDYEQEDTHTYRIVIDKAAADGGRTYTGEVFYETLELAKSDNGIVTFSAQCRGDGDYVKGVPA